MQVREQKGKARRLSPPEMEGRARKARRLSPLGWLGIGVALFLFVFVKNIWVHEDAFIMFRTVEQFFAGNGLRWNPHERVQVYTSVLSFFITLLSRVFSSNLYVNTVLLDFISCAGALYFAYRCIGSASLWCVLVAVLISSKGFMDYSSSGLGSAQGYLAVSLFLLFYFRAFEEKAGKKASAERGFWRSPMTRLTLVVSLVPLVRHDLSLLVAPVYAYAWLRSPENVGSLWRKRFYQALLSAAPLLLWSLFSLFYYGNPLPNTALSKTNMALPRGEIIEHGINYFYAHLINDTATLLLLAFGTGALLRSFSGRLCCVAAGSLLYCFYCLWVGGDYMLGRLLGVPLFFVGVALMTAVGRSEVSLKLMKRQAVVVMVLVAYGAFYAYSPLRWPLDHWDKEGEGPDVSNSLFRVVDSKLEIQHLNSIQARWFNEDPIKPLFYSQEVVDFYKRLPPDIMYMGDLDGVFAHSMGLERIQISYYGLTDPFLSRIPFAGYVNSDYYWKAGHLKRYLPINYPAVLKNEVLQLETPALHEYWEKVKFVTQGPLFNWERVKTAVLLSAGFYEHLLDDFQDRKAHPTTGGFVYDPVKKLWWLPHVTGDKTKIQDGAYRFLEEILKRREIAAE